MIWPFINLLPSEYQDFVEESGAVEPVVIRKRPPRIRCVQCRKFMRPGDEMHVMISLHWRLHIHCLDKALEKLHEEG